MKTIKERLAEKVQVVDTGWITPCWLFTGYVEKRGGYARIIFEGKVQGAHRVSYLVYKGEIPTGLHTDHLCRIRHCINPDHLEPVTQSENNKRGVVGNRISNGKHSRKLKTHCPQGHEYSGENVVMDAGKRKCRACKNDRMKRWWSKNGKAYDQRRKGRVR